PIQCKAKAFGRDFQNTNALGNHFLADTVSGDDCDHVGFHRTGSPAGGTIGIPETVSGCGMGSAPRSNRASAAPTSVIPPRNANPEKKFPVLLLRYPTIRGAQYAPKFPSAFTRPITDPTTLAGSVSVGMDQKGPKGP